MKTLLAMLIGIADEAGVLPVVWWLTAVATAVRLANAEYEAWKK